MVEITTFSPKPVTDKLDETNAKLDTANAKLDTANAKLDTLLSKIDMEQYLKIRYGRVLESIGWTRTSVVTGPGAGSVLVSASPPAGKRLWVYGYYIDSPEPNVFDLRWTSRGEVEHVRIRFLAPGTLLYTDSVPVQEGEPSDIDTKVEIVVVNVGTAGLEYRGRLLVGVTG